MTSNPSKLVSSKASIDKSRTRAAAPASVDDDFHEFFKQGDIGDYEGGVAYSQPPSKPLLPIDEPRQTVDLSVQRARRAFFARVVAIVLTACVALLVTAVRFKPHNGPLTESGMQRPAAETFRLVSPASPGVAQMPPVIPAVPQAAAAAAPPPPAQVDPDEDPEPEPAAKQDDPALKAPNVEQAKASNAPPVAKAQAVKTAATPATGTSAAKASGRVAQKATTATSHEPHPAAPSAPTAVRQSVAAFAVE